MVSLVAFRPPSWREISAVAAQLKEILAEGLADLRLKKGYFDPINDPTKRPRAESTSGWPSLNTRPRAGAPCKVRRTVPRPVTRSVTPVPRTGITLDGHARAREEGDTGTGRVTHGRSERGLASAIDAGTRATTARMPDRVPEDRAACVERTEKHGL